MTAKKQVEEVQRHNTRRDLEEWHTNPNHWDAPGAVVLGLILHNLIEIKKLLKDELERGL